MKNNIAAAIALRHKWATYQPTLKFQRVLASRQGPFYLGELTMYTVEWAKNFDGFQKGEYIDLKRFTHFYEEHITERFYAFETDSKQMPYFVIESRFSQLPHLMGLQYWNNIDVKQAEKQYKKLKTGEWTIEFLKKSDPGAFKQNYPRIEFTPHLYQLLYFGECRVRLLNPNIQTPFSNRKIDMLFERDKGNLIFFLELREKNPKNQPNVFVPTSITFYRKNSSVLRRINSLTLRINDILVEKIS